MIDYQKNNFDTAELRQQDYLFSTLEFTLPNKHSIFLRARWFARDDRGESDYAYFLAYSVPLNIPAARKKEFGILRGKVYDRDKGETFPLENVILSIDGLSTATNSKGEFALPSLKPGAYSLRVDQKSIGFDRTTSFPMPVLVEIQGGQTTTREIAVMTASHIQGRVELYALNPKRVFGTSKPLDPDSRNVWRI